MKSEVPQTLELRHIPIAIIWTDEKPEKDKIKGLDIGRIK